MTYFLMTFESIVFDNTRQGEGGKYPIAFMQLHLQVHCQVISARRAEKKLLLNLIIFVFTIIMCNLRNIY